MHAGIYQLAKTIGKFNKVLVPFARFDPEMLQVTKESFTSIVGLENDIFWIHGLMWCLVKGLQSIHAYFSKPSFFSTLQKVAVIFEKNISQKKTSDLFLCMSCSAPACDTWPRATWRNQWCLYWRLEPDRSSSHHRTLPVDYSLSNAPEAVSGVERGGLERRKIGRFRGEKNYYSFWYTIVLCWLWCEWFISDSEGGDAWII